MRIETSATLRIDLTGHGHADYWTPDATGNVSQLDATLSTIVKIRTFRSPQFARLREKHDERLWHPRTGRTVSVRDIHRRFLCSAAAAATKRAL
jgi:hypothetical protein